MWEAPATSFRNDRPIQHQNDVISIGAPTFLVLVGIDALGIGSRLQSFNDFRSRMQGESVADRNKRTTEIGAKATVPHDALVFTVNDSSHFYFHNITS
jgi:hypothetical protein